MDNTQTASRTTKKHNAFAAYCWWGSVIFINENENGLKRENNKFINEN